MLISPIGLLEPIQNQDHRITQGCHGNPHRSIHTKCPLSHNVEVSSKAVPVSRLPAAHPRALLLGARES